MGGGRLVAILYKANETDFNHLGLGPLNDAVSILVTEERNGMFELEMRYPIEGSRFVDLKLDRMIKADAGYNLKNQRFKIIRITKPIDGIVTVNAEHVSYLTQDLALKPTVNYSGSASQALSTWKSSIVDVNPFIVSSDITTTGSGSWAITDVKNAREALGGVSGSILETYGGEYRFDNYNIRLMAQRGVNSGALIAYGRNLVDLTQEESISDTFTSVYPYSVYQDTNNKEVLLTLPEYFIDSEYVGNYARRKILPVDFSNDEIKDVATLRARATSYMKSNGIGIPKVNMKIKYIDLAKTLDYKDLAILEEINLCDNVFVYFEQLGVNTSAKIIKTVWDDLLEQYDSIEVGEAKSSLSNSINATVDGKLETIVQRVNTIQLTADGLNVIHRGPEEPPPGKVGDLWYEPDGIYENMYQWDGIIWKKTLSTRDLGVLKQEVESVIAQAETDRTEAVQKINQAVIDSKVYADEVTTVSALRTKVLASDVITADMIQSNISVVDKIFATDANVNVLTAKTAFINSVKAVDIAADRITSGTFNGAKLNVININASAIVANTLSSITANTGALNVSGWLTMTSENKGILGEYDFGDNYGEAFNYRWFTGDYRLSHRHLLFTGKVYNVNTTNTKGSYLYDAETFLGNDYLKMRQYSSTNALLNRVDVNSNQIVLSKGNWNTASNLILRSDGTSYFGGDMLLAGEIEMTGGRSLNTTYINSASAGANINFNAHRTELADFRIGKDGSAINNGRVVLSKAVYDRTYSNPANVVVTADGVIGRSVSARKYKLNIKTNDLLDIALKTLDINPSSWFDKGDVESLAKAMSEGAVDLLDSTHQLKRHHGFIADEFHEKGATEVVIYDSNGEVEGLAYDRISIYHHELIKDLYKKIEEQNKYLESVK